MITEVPLAYLKKQLNFAMHEWTALDEPTKEWYKNAAREEIAFINAQST